MVIVEYVLDRGNGIVEVAFIELAMTPIIGKFAKLFLGFVEPISVAVGNVPAAVPLIEICMDSIHQVADGIRLVRPARWTILRPRRYTYAEQRGRQ